ncbi:hypothetical protein CHLRE_16g672041v5 [Chlamydomonas reinhardtii]|uniref:tRNA (guanine(37)-N1)-methyltransferase n=1 Tax=Chlamydomonas reinhardtii TaxID=3055 RepID=A0A2K3CU03_CHLRE|nr:uncharacterized protein CHLRE_16g672041v5 [Chlamydomonas reinhardtii]PNW71749.1 hypothetical protein CHLRE_16g672041v5 [Chlamydomonas reinhardtii]
MASQVAACVVDTAEASSSGREHATLDREAFKQILNLVALRVPARQCADMMKAFRGFTLDRPRLKCIVNDGDPPRKDTKLLLLEEGVTLESLTLELRGRVEADKLEVQTHQVTLEYSMLSADAVLKKLLPEGVDAPSSFETIGHIAHLNLRDEQLPYRHLIAQVLLDKNPHLKTIVNKVGSIENEFRVFNMEVIGGEQRLETEVTQHGARFKLDFSQVYWNSRLESEHLRLVGTMERGQVLVDMMAGIGPFAVPAAQKGLTVYANDLNPRSTHYLAVNVRLNRLGDGVRVFNMDGRAFLRLLCDTPSGPAADIRRQKQQQGQQPAEEPKQQQEPEPVSAGIAVPQAAAGAAAAAAAGTTAAAEGAAASPAVGQPAKRQRTKERVFEAQGPVPPVPESFTPPVGGIMFDHVVMNLPASAIEFLDAFNGAFDPVAWADRPLPTVHCYTFKRANETEADIVAKAEGYLGGPMEAGACVVHTVRDVAPNKLMLCLSFRVPKAVAFNSRS